MADAVEARPKLCSRAFLLSSHALNALSNCNILSLFPCRISLILTLPIFTSLSNKKSKSLNRPSSLSSRGSTGKALSGTGGEEGFPLMLSAMRKTPRPVQSGPEGSKICRCGGKWPFAQSTISESSEVSCHIIKKTFLNGKESRSHCCVCASRVRPPMFARRSRRSSLTRVGLGNRSWGVWSCSPVRGEKLLQRPRLLFNIVVGQPHQNLSISFRELVGVLPSHGLLGRVTSHR